MKFFYGVENNYKEVTNLIYYYIDEELKLLSIPMYDDCRCMLFGDPVPYVKKNIKIMFDDHNYKIINTNNEYKTKLEDYQINYFKSICLHKEFDNRILSILKLFKIHNRLNFEGGTMMDEFPEQMMAMMFVDKNAKILEIGANKGRNTLVLSSIVNDSSNIVTLETDKNSYDILIKNRDANNFKFKAINAGLSKRKLIQTGWNSTPSDEILPGSKIVDNILYDDLLKQYNLDFDTLVCDCEGALYYILNDFPEIMKNIKLIIIENDFPDLEKKKYCDDMFKEHGLKLIYQEGGGYIEAVCFDFFYQVWKKE